MKEMNFEQMEELNGGKNAVQCAGGIAGLAILAGCAIFAPEVTAAAMLTGEGAMLSASITEQALVAISEGC